MSVNPYASLNPTWQNQPMNLEAEASLLGALLSNNKALDRCPDLRSDHFAGEHHGEIFASIKAAVEGGHVADPVSLRWEYDAGLLAALVTATVSIINVPDYARVIIETAQARALIAIGESMAHDARSGKSLAEIARLSQNQIDSLSMGAMNNSQHTLDAAMDDALAAMERARKGLSAGISTGFKSIDLRLGSLEPSLVYVIAGRPAMGKSALGHQIAINVARQGVGVLELSLEMSARQLGTRALSSASGIALNKIKTGQVDLHDADRIVRARKELSGLPLMIDDAGGQSPSEIAAKARRMKRKHGLGLVMIDHLNLMRAEDSDARHGGTWATERASATVLQIAKDCGCPVLLLAQLNRGVEGREDKRPVLSDLRQAGAIEQDAYAVGFVYRPEYYLHAPPEPKEGERSDLYNQRLFEWRERKEHLTGVADVIWGKVRDGEPGTDRMRFNAETTSFGEVWA